MNAMQSVDIYLLAFVAAFFFRYLRLVVNAIAFASYRSVPPLDEERRLSTRDVTVVIPCLDGDSAQIRDSISTILANDPWEIIIVTIEKNHGRALDLVRSLGEKKIKVLSNPQANKRFQMLRGLDDVQTELIVFSDDDVFWKTKTLSWMIAPFHDGEVGATGTCQRLRRKSNISLGQRLWSFYAALYLERRNFDCASCNALDGGLPCLSGRTAMYRTRILTQPPFQSAFRNEKWRGSKLNHADDDNFLTRWLTSYGWKIKIQYSTECEVETTLAEDNKFLLQCLRWSRSNWRSNMTSLFDEKHVWRLQPWSTYSVFQTTLTAWALPWDILLPYLLVRATETWTLESCLLAYVLYGTFWMIARCVKLVGHFRRYPTDIIFLPLSVLFGYFHCIFIKPWALYTLDQTTWGSRTDADVDDAWRMMTSQPPLYQDISTKNLHPSPLHRSSTSRSVVIPILV